MIRGFFFDMDGTLVDTHQPNFEAYRLALAHYGVDFSQEDFKRTLGHQAQTFLRWLAPGLPDAAYLDIAERKAAHYKELMHLTTLNTYLAKFIEGINKQHAAVLVTSAKRRNADVVLAHHQLHDLFEVIITADDVKTTKPSPEGYLLALQKTGLQPNEVIAFEDSEPGIQAAEKAGITVVEITEFVL